MTTKTIEGGAPLRIRVLRDVPPRAEGRYVLYWMTAARRTRWNHALDRAVALARALDRPLLVLEALRCDYPWASERMHAFVLQGMRDNERALAGSGVLYFPYVEPAPRAGKGLLARLAAEACAVVADDHPGFFLPHMLAAAARRLKVRLEAVDGNGLLPLRATEGAFARAHDFRRFLQKHLAPHLPAAPQPNPLARAKLRPLSRLPAGVAARWPRATAPLLEASPRALAKLPIDHTVNPCGVAGGPAAGERALKHFLTRNLGQYDGRRNAPEAEATSRLSAHLHFGHVGTHQVFAAVAAREGWTPERLAGSLGGKRTGWWGMSSAAEAFLDQLVTWRELGFNFAVHRDDSERFSSLPDWARRTLKDHARDRRPQLYDRGRFEAAETHDALWNAAQNELRGSGRIHNYLRMLWGKKILHWSRSPEQALAIMIELNNRYALDGRDPNSYSGIFWVLGRYDRAWGPEREVFGKVRYMSSESTRRKLRVDEYVSRWQGAPCSEESPA